MRLLAFCALCACGQVPVTEEDLLDAVAIDARALNDVFHAPVVMSTGDHISVGLSQEPMPGGLEGYCDEHGVIEVSPLIRWDSRVPNIVLHELGHALGLQHSLDPGNIMFHNYAFVEARVGAQQIKDACAVAHCKQHISITVDSRQ